MAHMVREQGASLSAAARLERCTQEIGRELWSAARESRSAVGWSRLWSDTLMAWALRDPAFKVQLFRFVDVFPMLRSPREIHECLTDYLTQPGVVLPTSVELGLKAGALAKGIMARTITRRITALAQTFIAGTDAQEALPRLRELWDAGIGFSVDLLGEACVSRAEAAAYRERYLAFIDALPKVVRTWPAQPRLEADHLGSLPRANVSIKISALDARCDAIDLEHCVERLLAAIRPLLEAAARGNVFINFDMEQYALKDLTLALFERACEAVDFPAGIALQAYLRSGEDDARRLVAWSRRTGRQVTVRLIKGAYWDYEVVRAERFGWPVPVWTEKRETDACCERMAEHFVAAMPRTAGEGGVKLAVGSHNVRSIAWVLALLREHDLPESAVEVQMLYGMADPIKNAVLARGLRLREYVPLGEMVPGMAYLVRRLLENTSNQSWLRAGFVEDASVDELLRSPHEERAPGTDGLLLRGPERHRLSPAVPGLGDGWPFFNEPLRDFADAAQRQAFGAAVQTARVPTVPRPITASEAREAVGRAERAFASWSLREPLERARLLVAAAKAMRRRRDELVGVMIREAGKTWREADADVCEAIDFCEFYARVAVELLRPERRGTFVGELNLGYCRPRGVAVVISPWNFPLAICTGMTAAALVTGNCALVKPSGLTPGIAWAMCQIFWQSGVPRDVLQFVHGSGGEVGAALVRDPRVALIAFTGSRQVGLEILETAGRTPGGQTHVKKVVCEMGGKNAIIVDTSADLDEAVLGVRQSAFGYGGQKCSAASRAIVVEGVYDAFLKRLVESTASLVIGDPLEPGTDVGPVISTGAAEGIRGYIEVGRQEGVLELACAVPSGLEERIGKPYIGPHVFSGIQTEHRLAREEVFGPVLAVMRAGDFGEALAMANDVEYRLTGGVYSRKPAHLERARRELLVGNLYLNRGITGALVGRQPFGGFGLSGTGTQAGGREYLLHFVLPQAICEDTMRHGFAPNIERWEQ